MLTAVNGNYNYCKEKHIQSFATQESIVAIINIYWTETHQRESVWSLKEKTGLRGFFC